MRKRISMAVKARVLVSSVKEPYAGVQYVTMHAVYTNDPESPNFSYSQATPSLALNMTITNPEAFGFFVEGEEIDLMFGSKGGEG
jgi:hypothetical protein